MWNKIINFFKRMFKKTTNKKETKPSAKKTEATLCIIVGHEKDSPGAYGVHPIDCYEYEYNAGLAQLIKSEGEALGFRVEILFRDFVGIKGAYNNALNFNPDAIIELHFNSYNTKVEGCEVLYSDKRDVEGIREKAFAALLQNNIYEVMQSRNRPLKNRASGGERGFYNLSRTHKTPSVIIEPFFGDCPTDAKRAVFLKDKLAKAVVKSFEELVIIQG